MTKIAAHARIVEHPFAHLISGGRIDAFQAGNGQVSLQIHGLQRISSQVAEQNGKLFERATCKLIPLDLSFSGVTGLRFSSFFVELGNYALDDPARIISVLYSWREATRRDIFHLFGLHGPIWADLRFYAKQVIYDEGQSGPLFTLERDWSAAPPLPGRLVPEPKSLHRQFGGDPIKIKVNERVRHHKLFIGGVHIQPEIRPNVDVVFNVGEEPSKWVKDGQVHPADRWDNKGEGMKGMNYEEIRAEANWVIDRLQKDQSVLVHCAAGMNRSSTICCAVLILLEGLSAGQALERVREHHPWAKPDSNHWLALRWLEMKQKE
jgi:hypothetical protein